MLLLLGGEEGDVGLSQAGNPRQQLLEGRLIVRHQVIRRRPPVSNKRENKKNLPEGRTEALGFFVYSITSRMKRYIEYKKLLFFIFVKN